MIERTIASNLAMRLSGLAGFPAGREAVAEIINALAVAKNHSTAKSVVDDWINSSPYAPRPSEIRSALVSLEQPEYSTMDMYSDSTAENIDAMKAGQVWQPQPYPNRCSDCGGLGYLYAKIQAPKTHQQAGAMFDAVVPCRCRLAAIEKQAAIEENKKGRR